MMQAGIFTGYFPYSLKETAERIRKLNFNTVQLDLTFKDMDLSTSAITKDKCHDIRDTFRDHHLPVCCISGYTNIVHPDKTERKQRLDHLKAIIRMRAIWAALCDFGDRHVRDRKRLGPSSQEQDRRRFRGLRQRHPRTRSGRLRPWRGVSARNLRQQRRRLGERNAAHVRGGQSPSLGLLMDPTNYFEAHNIGDMDGELNRVFNALSDKIKIAHAKDVKLAGGGQVRKACRTLRGRRREPHVPRRRPDRIARSRAWLAELRSVSDSVLRSTTRTFPIIIEHLERATCRAPRTFLDGKLHASGV